MTKRFKKRIPQEHCDNVKNLALNSGALMQNITFNTTGCPFGILEICIDFEDEDSLSEFQEKIAKEIPCILQGSRET